MRYVVNARCTRGCLLNEVNLQGHHSEVMALYEGGKNRETIRTWLITKGITISTGTISRHKREHLDPMAGYDHKGEIKKRSHLEILEAIIEQGGDQVGARGVRISPEMTMRAIEMHHKLTEGSVWADFLEAIGAAAEEPGDAAAENPDVVASPEEQAQQASDA